MTFSVPFSAQGDRYFFFFFDSFKFYGGIFRLCCVNTTTRPQSTKWTNLTRVKLIQVHKVDGPHQGSNLYKSTKWTDPTNGQTYTSPRNGQTQPGSQTYTSPQSGRTPPRVKTSPRNGQTQSGSQTYTSPQSGRTPPRVKTNPRNRQTN